MEEKRSASVRAHTNCIFYTIEKENLQNILNTFQSQQRFLRAVGKQRKMTTFVKDLADEEQILEMGSSREEGELLTQIMVDRMVR